VCSGITNGVPLCSGGICSTTCNTPYSLCSTAPNQYCANFETDPANCGSCGRVCTTTVDNASPTCSNGGVCDYTCNQGFTECNGQCLDTSTDILNCGGCGNSCGADPFADITCKAGQCNAVCTSSYPVQCGSSQPSTATPSKCRNTQTDGLNCGACGNECSSQLCAAGVCKGSCEFRTNIGVISWPGGSEQFAATTALACCQGCINTPQCTAYVYGAAANGFPASCDFVKAPTAAGTLTCAQVSFGEASFGVPFTATGCVTH
jgi:hypothetical protein